MSAFRVKPYKLCASDCRMPAAFRKTLVTLTMDGVPTFEQVIQRQPDEVFKIVMDHYHTTIGRGMSEEMKQWCTEQLMVRNVEASDE